MRTCKIVTDQYVTHIYREIMWRYMSKYFMNLFAQNDNVVVKKMDICDASGIGIVLVFWELILDCPMSVD